MINRKFKKGNVLYFKSAKTFEGQHSFSIVFILSDITKEDGRKAVEMQDFSVNTYGNNMKRNSLLFSPRPLWLSSAYANECEELFKMKNKYHILKLAFDSLFNEVGHG